MMQIKTQAHTQTQIEIKNQLSDNPKLNIWALSAFWERIKHTHENITSVNKKQTLSGKKIKIALNTPDTPKTEIIAMNVITKSALW